MSKSYEPRPLRVPSGRVNRLSRMGMLTGGIVGRMALDGAVSLARGQRPNARDLLITPGNVERLTRQLAQMRGAAMKMGQLLSMEAGDVLPPELAQVLAHLRADAHFMPPAQLKKVLIAHYGADFLKRFRRFDVRPIAAASIGQVHRAVTRNGDEIALKVQYPGVRASIDSDVANVGALIRMSGLIPRELDMTPFLEEARRQLHDEADYAREARYLSRFGALLADDERYAVPGFHADYSNSDILAMDFMPGQPIEALEVEDQETRNRVAADLIALTFRELFVFGLMQTDPNFANYRYDPKKRRLILLDFGATQEISPKLASRFEQVLQAGRSADTGALVRAALDIGFFADDTADRHKNMVLDVMQMALSALASDASHDFGDPALLSALRERGMDMAEDRTFLHVPPMPVLYVQRKIAGLFLLVTRLRARVAIGPILSEHLQKKAA